MLFNYRSEDYLLLKTSTINNVYIGKRSDPPELLMIPERESDTPRVPFHKTLPFLGGNPVLVAHL